MRYQFLRTIVVEGTRHHAGDVVYGPSLPAGSIRGLLRCGHIVALSPEPVTVSDPKPDPAPASTPAPVQVPVATPTKPAKK